MAKILRVIKLSDNVTGPSLDRARPLAEPAAGEKIAGRKSEDLFAVRAIDSANAAENKAFRSTLFDAVVTKRRAAANRGGAR